MKTRNIYYTHTPHDKVGFVKHTSFQLFGNCNSHKLEIYYRYSIHTVKRRKRSNLLQTANITTKHCNLFKELMKNKFRVYLVLLNILMYKLNQ